MFDTWILQLITLRNQQQFCQEQRANFIRIHTLLKVAPVNVKVDLDKVYEGQTVSYSTLAVSVENRITQILPLIDIY